MRFWRGIALGVGLSLAAFGAMPMIVSAVATVSTPAIQRDQPLVVAGFKRSVAAHPGAYIQLYNSGSDIVNLKGWTLKTNDVTHALWSNDSYILPKTHVVVSYIESVASASYRTLAPIGENVTSVVVEPIDGLDYRPTATALPVYSSTDNSYDVWQRRTITTGYSTAAAPFDKTGIKTPDQYASMNLYDDGFYVPPAAPSVQIVEVYPYGSDCSPHDPSVLCGDYVKLYNPTAAPADLSDYSLRTDSSSASRTASNTFPLDGVVVQPGGYETVWLTDGGDRISLTNSGGYVWLEDVYGTRTYDETMANYPSAGSSQQGFAWAMKDDGSWAWTGAPAPLGANEFPVVLAVETSVLTECPAGKYRNPETNRCRSIEEAVNALAVCSEGQYRNPDTNRCKSAVTLASASLTPCKEGQERNPATNRCRSIASAVAELIPCDEDYERNPATNRCRKSQPVVSPVSTVAAVPAGGNGSGSPWVVGIAAIGAIGYSVYEWRHEVTGAATSVLRRLKK